MTHLSSTPWRKPASFLGTKKKEEHLSALFLWVFLAVFQERKDAIKAFVRGTRRQRGRRVSAEMSTSTLPRAEAASGVDGNPYSNFNGNAVAGGGDWSISGSGPWLLAILLSLIILMTACGNILLIGLVFAHRSLRCTSNCFLVSLFLSDLMVALDA